MRLGRAGSSSDARSGSNTRSNSNTRSSSKTTSPPNTRSPSKDPPSYDFSMATSYSMGYSNSETSKNDQNVFGPPPPIIRRSSSNILRNTASSPSLAPVQPLNQLPSPPKVSHTPYRPSAEQQSHIDSLSSTTPLSLATSSSHTEYFDMLPSFEMFQSILKRDNNQFNENMTGEPPVYGDVSNTSPTPPALTPVSSSNNLSAVSSGGRSDPSLQQQRDNNIDAMVGTDNSVESLLERLQNNHLRLDDDHEYNNSADANLQGQNGNLHHPSNIAQSHENYGHTVLDNIDKLPKLYDSPLDIQIYVTKKIPQPGVANELETRLKEYSIGDVVNGYITIENKSDKPVDFGLFIVTLEGTVRATERIPSLSINAGNIKRILMKKFLKMFDFTASYGYGYIPSSAGIEYSPFSVDPHDGCIFGVPDERVLQPHAKYKKFFTFKFPEKLLDNSCLNSVLPHVLPPPSLGIDKTSFYNRSAGIVLNKALGYGSLNNRGTPLLTKDYCYEDVSISYSIEAKFIDKLNAKDQKKAFSHADINDHDDDGNKYVVLKSAQYFLRFIPDMKRQLDYMDLDFQYGGETYASAGIDGKLFENYLNMVTWRIINDLNFQIERDIDVKLSHDENSDADVKHKNLIIQNSQKTTNNLHNFNVKDQIINQLANSHQADLEIDDNLYYHDERMIGSSKAMDIYGKKKKKILSSLIKVGTGKLFVRIPNKPFPYVAPKLLMKYNTGSVGASGSVTPGGGSTKISTNDYNSIFMPKQSRSIDNNLALSPVSSGALMTSNGSGNNNHMMDLYQRDDMPEHVDIRIVFRPTENSTQPPKIDFIEANIVSWTYNTDYPLPFKVAYDFFYCDPKEQSLHSQDFDDTEKTRENLQHLKDIAFNYLQFVKANEAIIPRESFLYLKSLKSLTFKKDVLKEFFQKMTHTSHPELLNSESSWKAKQSLKNKMLWYKDIKLPLNLVNKSNVNLIPSFQQCLIGRVYCLQVVVKFKGSGSDQKEFAENILRMDVPIFVG